MSGDLTGGRWVTGPDLVARWVPNPAPGRLPCGTPAAYREHLARGEVTDPTCRIAFTGRVPQPLKPCGTRAAYVRHYRHGEEPCDACKAALSVYNAGRRATRKVAA